VTANFLALYGCLFHVFHFTNFNHAPRLAMLVGLGLPVLGFLLACLVRRRAIARLIHARRVQDTTQLPRPSRWFPAVVAIGIASFLIPYLEIHPAHQGLLLVGAMGLITVLIVLAIHDVVLVMVDIAMVFERVTARLDQLLMPVISFLTFYALLVIVFACLYRIADMTAPAPQFMIDGEARRIVFVDALYFSVVCITTVGFGDIVPASLLVRTLTGLEIVCGIVMLLFGFSEVMRNADPDSDWHKTRQPHRQIERQSP
jgi:voltage-gated potassium channel